MRGVSPPPGKKEYIQFAAEAMMLVCQDDLPLLATIMKTGEDEFVRLAKEHMQGHQLTSDDFREVFSAMREKMKQIPIPLISTKVM